MADKWADESQALLGHFGQFLGLLGTAAGVWAFTLVLIALLNRDRPLRGALNATSFFLGLCAGYYAYSQIVLGYSGIGVVLFWLLAACTVVPLLAAALVWAIGDEPRPVRVDVVRALVIGAFAAVPIAQAVSYGFDVHPGNPSALVSDAGRADPPSSRRPARRAGGGGGLALPQHRRRRRRRSRVGVRSRGPRAGGHQAPAHRGLAPGRNGQSDTCRPDSPWSVGPSRCGRTSAGLRRGAAGGDSGPRQKAGEPVGQHRSWVSAGPGRWCSRPAPCLARAVSGGPAA